MPRSLTFFMILTAAGWLVMLWAISTVVEGAGALYGIGLTGLVACELLIWVLSDSKSPDETDDDGG